MESIKMSENNKGVLIYKSFVDERKNNKYKLNIQELYLWATLKRLMSYNYDTCTNINFIDQYTRQCGSYFYKKATKSRTSIRKCLESLKNKELIQYNDLPEDNNELFKITFAMLDDEFEYVPFTIFDSISTMEHLYIYFSVLKWEGTKEGVFYCSNSYWAQILGRSENTARKYLKECEEKGLIYRVIGDYIYEESNMGRKKQEIYKYKTTPFSEEEKTHTQRKREETNIAGNSETEGVLEEYVGYSFDTGNWLKSNSARFNVNDYIIYLTRKTMSDNESRKFVTEVENKIKFNMSKNEKYKYIHEKLLSEARSEIEKEREESIDEEAKLIIHKTNDIALVVNGKPIPYAEWNGIDRVERVYYERQEYVFDVDGYVSEIYFDNIYKNSEIEKYRD